jgi:hypothetical protein
MTPEEMLFAGFEDELEKLAANPFKGMVAKAKSRAGSAIKKIKDDPEKFLEDAYFKHVATKDRAGRNIPRRGVLSKPTESEKAFMTRKRTRHLKSEMGVGKTRVNLNADRRNAFFLPKDVPTPRHFPISGRANSVTSPARSSVIAHELGHASNKKGKIMGKLQAARIAQNPSKGVADTLAKMAPHTRAGRAASKLTAAGHVPTLVEEAAATVKGYRGLKRVGAPKSVRRAYVKNTAKGYGSYVASAVSDTRATAKAREAAELARSRRIAKKRLKSLKGD